MSTGTALRGPGLAAADLAVFGAIIVLLGWLRPDIVFPLIYLLLYPFIFATGRRVLLPRLLLASACSLVWMLIGGGIYGYRDLYYSIGPISIYPLAAWAVGFFLADLFASHFRWRHHGVAARFLTYTICYWFILILYETVAYHVYGIRNPATFGYPGLPLCDCIHAPLWVQVTYLSMGPIYFVLSEWLGLKRHSQ